MTEEFFDATDDTGDPLRADLIEMIQARDFATPRHQQRQLGPSEIGHPCMRKMAYGMTEAPTCNPPFDPLPSIIGTATHTWLQSAAEHANMVAGRTRWLTETRVEVAPGLSGSCDLYDCDTGTVIDWKVPGNNRIDKYRKDPGPVYRNQIYLYGKGFVNAGHEVKTVAIAFLPRGRTLRSMHIWKADYDPAIADRILRRRETVIGLLDDLNVEANPERYHRIPATRYDCEFCPWFKPEPKDGYECGGPE